MHVRADFVADYEAILKSELEDEGFKIPPGADVLLLYFNVLRRMVHPGPRTIHEAPSLECPPECEAGYELLKEKIRSGGNLLPHQSRTLVKKKRAAANDGMLIDWDIQHLHLGTDEEAPGVVRGTDYVLYGRFTDDEAYLLAVLPHGHWTDRSLVELLCRTWPETVQHRRLHGISPPSMPLTDEQFDRLRALNAVVPLAVDGLVYAAIGGGTMVNGTPMEVVMVNHRRRDEVARFQSHVLRDIASRRAAATASGVDFPEDVEVRLEKSGRALIATSPAFRDRWILTD